MMPADDTTNEQRVRLQRAMGDGYEVRDAIGSGGFATVFAAFDRQLKREVAVKVLRAELEAPVFRERFRREAESVAQLRHPNIVPIYAVGEADGMAWLIMPHLRGESLQQRIDREGRLPTDEATRILRDAASALSVAHRAGILHRDIKPDNIMLDGPECHVLLMDFGIAKALGETGAGVTATGMIVGTPQYMSPEQATGEKTIDLRSDLYSLGVVAFQMIAGAPPFSGSSAPVLIMKHIAEPAPSLLTVRRDCPRSLADVIAQCLEKDPAARWSSADELARALSGAIPSALTPGIKRISSRVSAAVAESGLPVPIRQFRAAALIAGLAVAVTIIVDVVLRKVIVSPIALLVSALVLASRYGQLWTAGYQWRDIISGTVSGLSDAAAPSGTTVNSATPKSLELRRLGEHGPRVHRARLDRGALIATLAQLSRSERDRMPDVLTVLDSLLAEATSLAAQLAAEGTVRGDAPTLAGLIDSIRKEPPSTDRDHRLRLAEVRSRIADDRLQVLERMERRLEECFATIEGIRVAVERIEAEGWVAAEPLLRQVMESRMPSSTGTPTG